VRGAPSQGYAAWDKRSGGRVGGWGLFVFVRRLGAKRTGGIAAAAPE